MRRCSGHIVDIGKGKGVSRPGLRTSQSGYCSATSIAQAPEPYPQSRILRGRGMGGKISLLSNIMLKIWCIYWRRSTSSYPPAYHWSEINPVLQCIALEFSVAVHNDLPISVVDGDSLGITVFA
ncbi:hypothetical protein VTK26DRAFT_7887 [Humicola hyalothermophila]